MLDFSIIIPTYRRQDVLALCLDHVAALEFAAERFEVRVYDNGGKDDSREVVDRYADRIANLTYTLNPPGQGLGFSLSRGSSEASGRLILEMNDDALIPPELLKRLAELFDSDRATGIIGMRAVEEGYQDDGAEVGSIDVVTGAVHGNFSRELPGPVDVDHVYGFCYAYRRELLDRGIRHDQTLLARNYSSGNRIETDHCLAARRAGYRVIYDSTLAVKHLAKPRGDMDERSPRWRLNFIRNTTYLLLKHYGPFRHRCLSLRFALTHDLGIRSAVLSPSTSNWRYFANGVRARCSAFAHYLKYLTRSRGRHVPRELFAGQKNPHVKPANS